MDCPATVSVDVSAALAPFGGTVTVTVPLPLPDGGAMDTKVWSAVAVHVQLGLLATMLRVVVPPLLGNET